MPRSLTVQFLPQRQEENIFGAPTQRRADQVCRTVLTRVQSLDSSFYPVFLSGDLATQKLFALAAVMACDTLFFDFVYEVIREKLIIGSNELEPKDVRISASISSKRRASSAIISPPSKP